MACCFFAYDTISHFQGFDDEIDIDKLLPLNGYGYSKQLFDQWVKHQASIYPKQYVGLKFDAILSTITISSIPASLSVLTIQLPINPAPPVTIIISLLLQLFLGACSSTTERDFDYLWDNNLEFTKTLWNYCAEKQISFIYASSAATYGDGFQGFDDEIDIDKLFLKQPHYH